MQGQPDSTSNQSLSDRITAAPPQEVVAMLLGGAQGFIDQTVVAIQQRDLPAKTRLVNRVSAIIEQLVIMLNFEGGGEVVDNLSRIYEWWLTELFEASSQNATDRLRHIAVQMGNMQETWQSQVLA